MKEDAILNILKDNHKQALNSIRYWEGQVEYRAKTIKEIRERFRTDMENATAALKKANKDLLEAQNDALRWEAAMRMLTTMQYAGDMDAIIALGTESVIQKGEDNEPHS